MALFQKNPYDTSEHKPIYTLGLNKSVLVIGLGNIGKEYENTRHNLGFTCVEALAVAHNLGSWVTKKDLKCQLVLGNVGDTRLILCKPTTMMNLSGEAVRAVMDFYKIADKDVVVVHDELDIDFGQIRSRVGGGTAGHNGVKSLVEHIGEGFGRVRVGIGPKSPPQIDGADFVLGKLSKDEESQLKHMTREVVALLTEFIASGKLPEETRSFIV